LFTVCSYPTDLPAVLSDLSPSNRSLAARVSRSTRMVYDLGPEKALIFRITHRDNVPWILDHGIHCRNSAVVDPNFVPIGMRDLIERRRTRPMKCHLGGTLADYVPYYFTSHSPMFYNIITGYNGLRQFPNEEIVILVSSLHTIAGRGLPFVFTDRHAVLSAA
jgi:hypothetical protein